MRGTVEETLNAMLDAEADTMCGAQRYEMNFYNQDRRHASLGRMTPDQIYYDLPSGHPLAA